MNLASVHASSTLAWSDRHFHFSVHAHSASRRRAQAEAIGGGGDLSFATNPAEGSEPGLQHIAEHIAEHTIDSNTDACKRRKEQDDDRKP